MRLTKMSVLSLAFYVLCISASAQKKKVTAEKEAKQDSVPALSLDAFQFRALGPALMSGRIYDLAFNQQNSAEYYVAVASGGVWKTSNNGITYEPVFDGEGSYSIGCVTIDPNNPFTVWVGTGEANNQRSVAYGDGVYKSDDGGKSWTNMGLKKSEHIGRIVVDPKNSDIVYVAAYGPLWDSGGDRGIYKSVDAGKTWKAVLTVSANTGFCDILMDPRNSNVLYASAHQRQRKVYGYVAGGPESALYKSTDGGNTWNKLSNGLPGGNNVGRIGIALAASNPDVMYAVIEASDGKGGFFKSVDRGASWEKRSSYSSTSLYYQRIFVDPSNENKIFCGDFLLQVSVDGGATWSAQPTKNKHVDNHVVYIDPKNSNHIFVGCDGGLYETYDDAKNWNYKANLNITQFYKVTTDNAFPFYNVFGGTQDNSSIAGPSRTINAHGISNTDWFITTGGDGFETQVDQEDPNIIYAESQYGGLVRYDKKSGEQLDIRPVELEGEPALRWNWDAPLLISQHLHTRIYFGANKLYRSDDRGNTWTQISPDLSRQTDRNKLTIMGKVWSVDALAKNVSTDVYGQLTTIAESKFDQNILYAGTDDGLIQMTVDGGKNWTKIDNIPGVPKQTYVNQIITSLHDKNTVYVTFNHHRFGDFHPYIFRSKDGGKTWSAIQSDLPQRGSAYCIAEDHINPDLLFAGTEFGVYCSIDGGAKWLPMKGGLPTIAIRDMEIQRRESDLVLATFGRGFYVLDDYSPLRNIKKEDSEKEAVIYPVKEAWMYDEATPLGGYGDSPKGSMGESFFTTPNPKVGSVFTYFLKDDIQTIKQKRQKAEADLIKRGQPVYYPPLDSLRIEDAQPKPYLLFTVYDAAGNPVRRIKTDASKGLHRIVWDFRYPGPGIDQSSDDGGSSYKALPGNYKVGLHKFEDGVFTELAQPVPFKTVALNWASLPATDIQALQQYSNKVNELRRVADGTYEYFVQLGDKLKDIKATITAAPQLPLDLFQQTASLQKRIDAIFIQFNGDNSLSQRQFETLPGIRDRLNNIVYGLWGNTAAPTTTFQKSYDVAVKQFTAAYKEVQNIDIEIKKMQQLLEQRKAPAISGSLPEWK